MCKVGWLEIDNEGYFMESGYDLVDLGIYDGLKYFMYFYQYIFGVLEYYFLILFFEFEYSFLGFIVCVDG